MNLKDIRDRWKDQNRNGHHRMDQEGLEMIGPDRKSNKEGTIKKRKGRQAFQPPTPYIHNLIHSDSRAVSRTLDYKFTQAKRITPRDSKEIST